MFFSIVLPLCRSDWNSKSIILSNAFSLDSDGYGASDIHGESSSMVNSSLSWFLKAWVGVDCILSTFLYTRAEESTVRHENCLIRRFWQESESKVVFPMAKWESLIDQSSSTSPPFSQHKTPKYNLAWGNAELFSPRFGITPEDILTAKNLPKIIGSTKYRNIVFILSTGLAQYPEHYKCSRFYFWYKL